MVDWGEVPDIKFVPARWPSGHRRADRRMLPRFEPAQDSDLGHYVFICCCCCCKITAAVTGGLVVNPFDENSFIDQNNPTNMYQ
jgi:hypothetical protein